MTPHATTASAQTSDLDVRIATLEAGLRDVRRQIAELHRALGRRGAASSPVTLLLSEDVQRKTEAIGPDKVIAAIRWLYPSISPRSASWGEALRRVVTLLDVEEGRADD